MSTVLLHINNNLGYAPDQIDSTLTLGDLLAAVEQAIADHGEDAVIVTEESGNHYGARFGNVEQYEDMFTSPDDEEDTWDTPEDDEG